MRLRKLCTVVAAAVFATGLMAAPATAGTGESGYCFDGGWTDIAVLPGPITLGIETNVNLSGTSWVALCYATSEVGYGGAHTTGGLLKIAVNPDGSGFVQCRPDSNDYVVLVDCEGSWSFAPTSGAYSVQFANITVGVLGTPVTIGRTGVASGPGYALPPGPIVVNPLWPCVYVHGIQIVPGCGTPIL